MAASSNFLQNKVLDQLFRAQSALGPATLYIGLVTTASSAQGPGSEVTGGSYARVAVTCSLANWSGTQGAGTTTASSNATGTSGTISNNIPIVFPSPSANWGTVVGFVIMDASTGGNEYAYAPLTASKTVNNGDAAPSFAAAALSITLG